MWLQFCLTLLTSLKNVLEAQVVKLSRGYSMECLEYVSQEIFKKSEAIQRYSSLKKNLFRALSWRSESEAILYSRLDTNHSFIHTINYTFIQVSTRFQIFLVYLQIIQTAPQNLGISFSIV